MGMAAEKVVDQVQTGKGTEGGTRESRRIPELDGIRGLAILMVVCMHMFYTPGYGGGQTLAPIGRVFALGWSGVDLFFVLSGFLIGGILLDNRESTRYFQTFYARRFFRIVPAYYAWILLFVVVVKLGGGLLHENTRSGIVPEVGWGIFRQLLFLQNLWEQHYVKLALWWFGPSWSLAVEEQFYLVTPLLLKYLPRRFQPMALAAIVGLVPALRYVVHVHCVTSGIKPTPAYRLMPCRADSLAMGIALAFVWRRPQFREWVREQAGLLNATFGALLIAVLVLAWKYSDPLELVQQTVGYSILALFFSLLIALTISRPQSVLANAFRSRTLRELGRVSYCMYLIHVAVGYFWFGLIERQIPNFASWKSGGIGLLSIVTTYVVACVSWKLLEEPMLRFGHRHRF